MKNRWLKDILKKNSLDTFLAIITKIVFSIFIVLTSYYLSSLFDSYGKGIEEFNKSLFTMTLILISTVLFSFISDYFNSRYIRITNIYVRKVIDNTIILRSEELITNKNTGKHLSWYLNDVAEVENKYFSNIINLFYYGSLVIFSAISIISLHWILLITTLFLLLVSLVIPNIASKYIYNAQKRLTETNESYTEEVRDNLESLNILFLSNRINYFKEKMLKYSNEKENEYFRYNITNAKINSLMMLISLISQIGLIVFALYISSLGYTSLGSVLSIASLSGNLFNGVQALVSSITILKSVEAISEKYNDVLEKNENKNINVINKIVLNDVRFSYGEKQIFDNFNHHFIKKKYALIGNSGSGKSTLLKLILGIEKPDKGKILINEINLSDINKNSLYKNIAYIEQNIYLINDSIKNNILLGSEIEDDVFNNILKKVNLLELISSLPNKENTIVTSNGQEISGGEKQRIAIARALVKNVDFIFIDETTSQLDKKNREALENMILSLKDIGVIMISHNYNEETLYKFDEVINLDKNQIATIS
ncbi:ATP-binding cassette domain-containing protein [Helcococcus kunzii]|uniref:ATP-binding cassette domain-containing protein n=1 Tax=Helcococcus kunzii TaxID=40091 RepID=UPI0024ACE9CD|nr:ABC transporter ATP-binding protein [Helcococcus kunzii]